MISDDQYELRAVLEGHEKGVRCLCIINNDHFEGLENHSTDFEYIVSADINGTIIIWEKASYDISINLKASSIKDKITNDNNEIFSFNKKVEIHEKCVYSLCCSKYLGLNELKNCSYNNIEEHLYVYSGGGDRNIYLFNLSGSIELSLQGHTNSVCSIVEQNKNTLLSGDWNGEVFIWRINQVKEEIKNDANNLSNINSIDSKDFGNNKLEKGKDNTISYRYKYTYSIVKILKNHKYGTYVNILNESILTLSQDNILHIWNKEGDKIHDVANIHTQSVRNIIIFNDNKNVLTFSNDEYIHIYDYNFNLLKKYKGHQGFIFYVSINEKEKLMYSCSDDKTIKIWTIKDIFEFMNTTTNDNNKYINKSPIQNLLKNTETEDSSCLQTIYLYDSIWNVKLLRSYDLVCACNDKYIRIYTNKEERKLSKEDVEQLEQMYKKENIDIQQKEQAQDITYIKDTIGKEGEIKIFKNNNKYEAYKYENDKWVLIGDVVDDQQSGKKFYMGDIIFKQGYYDELISIDIGNNVIKILPLNKGDNVYIISEQFCKRENISISYIKEIVNFVNTNYSSILNQTPYNNNDTIIQNNDINKTKKKFHTLLNAFTMNKAPLDKIFEKIKEFNSKMYDSANTSDDVGGDGSGSANITDSGNNNGDKKFVLTTAELNTLSNLVDIYKANINNNYKFHTADINLIIKLFTWPVIYIFPTIDIYRIFILNSNCDFLINNKYSFNAFTLVYNNLSYYITTQSNNNTCTNNTNNTNDPLLLCCLKFYLNMFYLSSPRFYIFRKCSLVVKQLNEIRSNNTNVNILLLKIFFNFVITLNENNDKNTRNCLFEAIHSFINKINDLELLYIYSICFHTSYNIYTKQTIELINKYDTIKFIQTKLIDFTSKNPQQNEKTVENIRLILNELRGN
ncbi:polyubiquitin binding protein, putative [Hepatocystis sp. ex Piliocolobus tephrosceles]|nr:polyubiquitin binding protein, putative [Hepatocystis sp. ex Piliocolobus tephrosceles]